MGTIAEKLSYLADTKDLFKDRLNSLGAEITSSTTFRNYLNWLDTFYGEVSDKTDISQNGIVGRTSQESTTGKNLLPPTLATDPNYTKGTTTTYDSNTGYYTTTGTTTNTYPWLVNADVSISTGTTLTISSNFSYRIYARLYYNSSSYEEINSATTPTKTVSNDIIRIAILSNIPKGTQVNETYYVQLEEGSTATSFEPFTNGASPNPDYPQPINNLSGDVPYKVSGKNLCNLEDLKWIVNSNGVVVINKIYWNVIIDTRNENSIYIKGNYSLLQDGALRIGGFNEYPQLNSQGTRITYSGNASLDTSTYNYVLLCFGIDDNHTIDEIRNSFMVNYGSTALPYEPYIEPQTFNIPLGDIELCEIDTYEDKIYSNNGRFYLNKNIDKNFENSFTSILTITSTLADNLYGYACSTRGISSYSELGAIISNIFVPKILGSQTDTTNPNNVRFNMGIAKHTNTTQVVITIDKKYLETGTTTEFSNFLNNNNFEYYRVLATPTTTEITQENYPSLYNALKQIQDYLTAYKINKEFILGYSSPEIEY